MGQLTKQKLDYLSGDSDGLYNYDHQTFKKIEYMNKTYPTSGTSIGNNKVYNKNAISNNYVNIAEVQETTVIKETILVSSSTMAKLVDAINETIMNRPAKVGEIKKKFGIFLAEIHILESKYKPVPKSSFVPQINPNTITPGTGSAPQQPFTYTYGVQSSTDATGIYNTKKAHEDYFNGVMYEQVEQGWSPKKSQY